MLIVYEDKTITIKEINYSDPFSYFTLIRNNRERLKRYFPKTTSFVWTTNAAKELLKTYQQKRIKKMEYPLGIYRAQNLIGWISIKTIDWTLKKCELGYYVDKNEEGKGIISLALKQVCQFCFNILELKTLFLRIGIDNISSLKVAQKAGFKKISVLKNTFKTAEGEQIDLNYLELKNTE